MLIPRFSLRAYFVATLLMALVGIAGSFALRGHDWAVAVLAALGSLVVLFVLYAVAFICAWGFVEIALARAQRRQRPASPFATDRPAPQILPPVKMG